MADHKIVKSLLLPSEIDENAASVLKSTLMKLINDGARKIICNFSVTNFLSKHGAEELVNVARFLAKIDGELGICWIKPEVKAAIQDSHVFKFYSMEESVAVIALRNLVTYFELYEDVFDIKVRMENLMIHIEIYLGFSAEQSMGQVQQAVDLIRHSLERDIKDVQVLIIPSARFAENTSAHPAKKQNTSILANQTEAVQELAQAVQETIPEDFPSIPIKSFYYR